MDEMAKESTPTTKARQHGPKAGTPRTQRMTGEQRRTQLLDVAEQVFGDVGYTDTTMDLIAERAAITKPVLYSHFGSKDKLLIAVLWRATEDLIEELESLTARLDPSIGPREAVATVIRSYTSFVLGRPAPSGRIRTTAPPSPRIRRPVSPFATGSTRFSPRWS